ncbi:Cupredoxin [Aspergillus pseudodeflectus]|uniref:Cupredoxin n=1 Tax=Aspergillus pseudodeflectus TaxID=176178 RepID=A0ABR4K0M0_9EURO
MLLDWFTWHCEYVPWPLCWEVKGHSLTHIIHAFSALNVTQGDGIIANVYNGLENQTTSVHWHGIFQNGTTHMDCAPAVTHCGIAPGSSFTYNFTVDQAGTYWYHSHTRGQYPDGLRQALIITDPVNPYLGQYEEEQAITLSDWYHDQLLDLLEKFISLTNPTGAEPNFTVSIKPGKTYLFLLVNIGAFASQRFWIEGHSMRVVEVDGVWTNPLEANMLYISVAQRYRYNDEADRAPAAPIRTFDTVDDMDLVPTDGLALYPRPNHGRNTNAFILAKGEIVDIVLNNDDTGKHPFHLHGHGFQVITPPSGHFVIRKGIWLFHCHIEWHMASGLAATMIEAPLDLQRTLAIPRNHYQACYGTRTPTEGNAAEPLPDGFTVRGIIALIFSCIAVILGLATIV